MVNEEMVIENGEQPKAHESNVDEAKNDVKMSTYLDKKNSDRPTVVRPAKKYLLLPLLFVCLATSNKF